MKDNYNSITKSICYRNLSNFAKAFQMNDITLIELGGPEQFIKQDTLANQLQEFTTSLKVHYIESNRKCYKKLIDTRPIDNTSSIHKMNLSKFYSLGIKSNLVFADYCGAWSKDIVNDFKVAADNNIFMNGCILGITLWANERVNKKNLTKRSNVIDYYKVKKAIEEQILPYYKLEILCSIPYKQHKLSDDMVLHIFIVKQTNVVKLRKKEVIKKVA